MLDDKDLIRAWMKGIEDGINFVFDTLTRAGIKNFALKDAERYRQLVKKEMNQVIIKENLPRPQ